MQGLLAGSVGVIEEFFDAELVADSSDRARRASVITPARIAGLPWEQRDALYSALIAPGEQLVADGEQLVADYQRALQSKPGGARPTMLLDRPTLGGYRTLEHGLRVVAYFGRVLVDDPLSSVTRSRLLSPEAAADEHLHEVLARLAEVRPLIAGGNIMFFPPELAERLRETNPAIAKESAQRTAEKRREVEEIALSELSLTSGAEVIWPDTTPQWDPLLDRLEAAVSLPVNAMDTTGDTYVLRYLGKTSPAFPTRLASVQLPRLELLPPRELAALLSSDEVLAEVRSALDDALQSVPEGLAHDPERAAQRVDNILAGNLKAAVQRLRRSIRRRPDAAEIGGTAVGVGATVLAGVLTGGPGLAVGLGVAGAASGLTASWLHQWQQHRKQQPAIRVLTHLAAGPQTTG